MTVACLFTLTDGSTIQADIGTNTQDDTAMKLSSARFLVATEQVKDAGGTVTGVRPTILNTETIMVALPLI